MKILCNLTWRCSLGNCLYCWIYGREGVGDGFVFHQQDELTVDQWCRGLNQMIPPFSTIDFCGGEPTMLGDGLVTIASSLPPQRFRWAITSNLSYDGAADVLETLGVKARVNCVSVNCSYHHGVPLADWLVRFRRVREVYGDRAKVNVIENPFWDYGEVVEILRGEGFPVNYEPYQNPRDGDQWSPVLWKCSAGMTHCVIAPNGAVYSCLCAFRSKRREEYRIGHLLERIVYLPPKELCDLSCDPVEAKCWEISRAGVSREVVAEMEAKQRNEEEGRCCESHAIE